MIKRKHANELAALRRLALEDVLQASEADLREQAEEEGLDFNELAEKIRSSMREAAASVLREQLVKNRAPASTQRPAAKRPSLERIKEAIREVFAREPELRVAFRDGRQQSQSDWESLYDDLVRLGALKPDERD